MSKQCRLTEADRHGSIEEWADGYPLSPCMKGLRSRPVIVTCTGENAVLSDLASNRNPNGRQMQTMMPLPRECSVAVLGKIASNYYNHVEVYSRVQLMQKLGSPRVEVTALEPEPRVFEAAPGKAISVTWDVVALTRAGDDLIGRVDPAIARYLALVPVYKADEPSMGYALALSLQKRDGSQISHEKRLDHSAAVVTGDGLVTVNTSSPPVQHFPLSAPNLFAHVLVLQETDAPQADTPFLIGDGIDCRGKFDYPD